jgi:hypothetical protein
MPRKTPRYVSAVAFLSLCLVSAGCTEKKADSGNAPTPAPNTPSGDPQTPQSLGEAKYKLPVSEFVNEYIANWRAANSKYSGQVVELRGVTTGLATVDLDSRGVPVGTASDRKASFVLGEPDAKRVDTIHVRGLRPTAIGKVYSSQEVTVKGKVARYDQRQPIELNQAELIDAGMPDVENVTLKQLNNGPEQLDALVRKCEGTTAIFSGTIVETLTEGSTDVIEIENEGHKVKCYLSSGITTLFPAQFEKGKTVKLGGTLRLEKSEVKWWIEVRDCVPVDAGPKG